MSDKLIKCKACGADMAKSAKVCPSCGAKNKKHTALWIILIVIAVIAIVSAIGGGSKPKLANDSGSGQAQSQSSAPEEQKQEKTTFGVGERVDLNNVVVTLVNVSENSGGNYMTPADGKIFVVCEFEIENNSTSDIAVSSILSFESYIDDYSTNMSISATASTGGTQLDGSVAAGKKMNGVIGYEADSGWKNLEIKFTPSFWSGKDITFVYEK